MKTRPTKRNRSGASQPDKRARVGSTRLLGAALLEHIKGGIEAAWYDEWDKVKKELRGEVYAHLRGFDEVWIEVIDGCAGETWWEIRLRDLVTELMKDRDGKYDAAEQADWHDALAADLERQATRLRKHAAKIRPPNL